MKCYVTNGQGLEGLKLVERDSPVLKNSTDVLVKVKACSLNYRDLMIAKGQYSPGKFPEFIPLSDMAGEVIAVGQGVKDLKPGDRVLNAPMHWPAGKLIESWARTFIGGLGLDGVLAEQVVFPADSLLKIPSYLNYIQASTFTVAGLTAWAAVVVHGKTVPGEWVLLQGSGGVSIFAAQLAHAMGARTILTTSNPQKAEFVKSHFNVYATVNYLDKEWPKQVKEITQGRGVDVVVDVAGGETLATSLKVCNIGARVAVIGVLDGPDTVLPIREMLKRQIQLRGIFMESTQELQALLQAAETLKIVPHVDKVFPLNETFKAYRYLEEKQHIGKIVITFE